MKYICESFSSTILAKSLQKRNIKCNHRDKYPQLLRNTSYYSATALANTTTGRWSFSGNAPENLKTVIWSIAVKQPKITMAVPEDAAYQEKRDNRCVCHH